MKKEQKQGRRKRQKELEEKSNKKRFPKLYTINFRRDGLGLLLLFIAVFVLFAISAPRTIILEDDGLFVSAAWFAGVAHPPGYPLYTILGWISSHLLPFGEIPWRVHLVSGFMGAVTCICIAWLVLRRTGNRPAAYLAGAALAVSEHFWSQAIIADVYTTNTALLFMILVMVQEAVAKRDTLFWFVAAFLYGLGLANHWPLLILGSPIFIAYIFTSGKEFWGKLHYLIFSVLIPAGLLYGWLVWRSHQDIPVNFLGAINSLSEMISFISREGFANMDLSTSTSLINKVYYARYFITEWFLQLSLLGGLLALWGVIYTYRNGWRFGFYGEVITVFTSSLLLIWVLDFDYEYLRIAIFRPFPLVSYCILALWLGYGINILMQVTGKLHKSSSQIIITSLGVIILTLGIYNGRTNYRANDRFAEQLAQSIFDVLEQNSILVTSDSAYGFTTMYYNMVEGKRPDIRLLNFNGVVNNDRVVSPLWSEKQKSEAWREFAKHTDRPLYSRNQSSINDISGKTGLSYISGIVYKSNNSNAPKTIELEANDSAKAFFKKILVLPDTKDRWVTFLRNDVIKRYGKYLGYVIASNNSKMNNYIKDVLPLAENNYWSLMGMITSLLDTNKYIHIAEKYLEKARHLPNNELLKSSNARIPYLEGVIAKKRGNSRKARNLFRKSIKINPKKTNLSYKALKEL